MANITVKGPEGLSVQFPEGTPSDVINKVMTEAYNKMIGATQQPQSQAEIGRDVIGRVGVGQGLMMGFGDEIAAALRSTEYTGGGGETKGPWTRAQTKKPSYEQALTEERAAIESARKQYPNHL